MAAVLPALAEPVEQAAARAAENPLSTVNWWLRVIGMGMVVTGIGMAVVGKILQRDAAAASSDERQIITNITNAFTGNSSPGQNPWYVLEVFDETGKSRSDADISMTISQAPDGSLKGAIIPPAPVFQGSTSTSGIYGASADTDGNASYAVQPPIAGSPGKFGPPQVAPATRYVVSLTCSLPGGPSSQFSWTAPDLYTNGLSVRVHFDPSDGTTWKKGDPAPTPWIDTSAAISYPQNVNAAPAPPPTNPVLAGLEWIGTGVMSIGSDVWGAVSSIPSDLAHVASGLFLSLTSLPHLLGDMLVMGVAGPIGDVLWSSAPWFLLVGAILLAGSFFLTYIWPKVSERLHLRTQAWVDRHVIAPLDRALRTRENLEVVREGLPLEAAVQQAVTSDPTPADPAPASTEAPLPLGTPEAELEASLGTMTDGVRDRFRAALRASGTVPVVATA